MAQIEPNIVPGNPFMLPLVYEGKEYLTSQRLHADYLRNAEERGEKLKYKNHSDFLRVIKSIPNYNILIEQEHIFILRWPQVKSSSKQDWLSALKPLFAARGYQEVILLTSTAQMELTHHLDDELNQELAYRHSQQGAAGINGADVWLRQHGFLKYEKLYDFPLFAEFCRVWGVKIPVDDGTGQHWPGCGTLMNQFIYGMFPEEIQIELDKLNPINPENKRRPRRKQQHFQDKRRWDTLKAREGQILSLLRLCDDGEKETFKGLLERHDRRLGLDVKISAKVCIRLSTIASNQLVLFDATPTA